MHELEYLIELILEKGAEAAPLKEAMLSMAELELQDKLVVYLRVLSKNPDLILVRLQLAKLYWQLQCHPFALAELQSIYNATASTETGALADLIRKLGGVVRSNPGSVAGVEADNSAKTLASLDFDIEVIDEGK